MDCRGVLRGNADPFRASDAPLGESWSQRQSRASTVNPGNVRTPARKPKEWEVGKLHSHRRLFGEYVVETVSNGSKGLRKLTLLGKGGTYKEVAAILGDRFATICHYYAKWTEEYQGRQDSLIRKIHGTDLTQVKEQASKC